MTWFNDPRRYYEEDGRYYHTWGHIQECLALLSTIAERLSVPDYLRLRVALVYHDAVYDTRSKDSEERSADLAEESLREDNADGVSIAEVRRLILLTKRHDPADDDALGQTMCDIDCAILGAEPDTYDEYVANTRKEYDHVNPEDWRFGRGFFLAGLLDRPKIFHSSFFQHLEEPARANIARELETLK